MTLEAQKAGLAGRLTDVTAQFVPGTITAICGPNGAGKSTLLKLLAGLLDADAGRVEFDGGAMSGLHARERAKAIGYLPQTVVFALLGKGIRVDGAWQLGLGVGLFVVSAVIGLLLLSTHAEVLRLSAGRPPFRA